MQSRLVIYKQYSEFSENPSTSALILNILTLWRTQTIFTVHWTIHQTAAGSPDNAVKFTDTHFASEIFTMRKRTACHPLKAILKIISTRRLTVTTSQPRRRRWTPRKTTSCSASALRDKETSGSTAARAGTLATCASASLLVSSVNDQSAKLYNHGMVSIVS